VNTHFYGPQDFVHDINVPRETLERLEIYATLLRKWQVRINLIGNATLPELWQRHMLDSAQLIPLAPAMEGRQRVWVDLGAGAGFPGLVIAIMTGDEVHLIEANAKKCAFLREVARATGAANAIIHDCRIEDVGPLSVDVVVARAFAPLDKLMGYAAPYFGPQTTGLFLKGQSLDDELDIATKYWNIEADQLPSRSDNKGRILRVRSVQRAAN
jgi:16S rRNA (guanine527-N7)-methyltransferase